MTVLLSSFNFNETSKSEVWTGLGFVRFRISMHLEVIEYENQTLAKPD